MEELELEGPSTMDEDVPTATESNKRQKLDGVAYRKVSGKVWKSGNDKASTKKTASLSSTWEKKMANKAGREHFMTFKKEAVAAAKSKRKAAADQRRLAKERKDANKAKSTVVQKITNSATLKKMMKSKKDRKKLKTADTN